MNDIVDRARRNAKVIYIAVAESVADEISGVFVDCADEIGRLRAALARLQQERDGLIAKLADVRDTLEIEQDDERWIRNLIDRLDWPTPPTDAHETPFEALTITDPPRIVGLAPTDPVDAAPTAVSPTTPSRGHRQDGIFSTQPHALPVQESMPICEHGGHPMGCVFCQAVHALPPPCAYALDEATKLEAVTQRDGRTLWAVRRHSCSLSTAGEWEYEPLPTARSDEFIRRNRFETTEQALSCFRRFQQLEAAHG